jgi:hypothetical protein
MALNIFALQNGKKWLGGAAFRQLVFGDSFPLLEK